MIKQVIITFTRHEMTTEQLDQAVVKGAYDKSMEASYLKDVKVVNLAEAASKNLLEWSEVEETASLISSTILEHSVPNQMTVLGVFGVFPAPLLEAIAGKLGLEYASLYSAWNIQRTAEGGKPTFEFKRWCKIPLKSNWDGMKLF